MPKGIKGFQKGHPLYLTREQLLSNIEKAHKYIRENKDEIRRKISKANSGVKRPDMAGEKNWAWRGGVTQEQQTARKTWAYRAWRNIVYIRDRWTCQICQMKCVAGNIVAHHIKLFSKHPEVRFNTENGQTLCRPCHARLHKQLQY